MQPDAQDGFWKRGALEYTGVEMLYPQVSERRLQWKNVRLLSNDALSALFHSLMNQQ